MIYFITFVNLSLGLAKYEKGKFSVPWELSYISKILRISNYGTASTDSAAYILGGFLGAIKTSIIAQFQNNEWQRIGDLKEIKSDPSAILNDGEYLIIGGDGQKTRGRLVN